MGAAGGVRRDAGAGAAQASSASKARRVVLAGAVLLALGAVAVVAMISGEAVKTGHVRMELSDRNEFESQPAWYLPCVCMCMCTHTRPLFAAAVAAAAAAAAHSTVVGVGHAAAACGKSRWRMRMRGGRERRGEGGGWLLRRGMPQTAQAPLRPVPPLRGILTVPLFVHTGTRTGT